MEENKEEQQEKQSSSQQVVKINKDKEMIVNIENFEQLYASTIFLTNEVKKAKEGLSVANFTSNFGDVREDFKRLNNKINTFVDRDLPDLVEGNQKEIKKLNLPTNEQIASLNFDIKKISNVAPALKKIRGIHIIISILMTAIVIIATMFFTKYDDEIINRYLTYNVKKEIKKENWIVPKDGYQIISKSSNRVIFEKIN
jgi:hypothetical protein